MIRLQSYFSTSFFAEVRRLHAAGEWPPLDWHFGQGMFVRNLLRTNVVCSGESRYERLLADDVPVIKDEQLPPLPELYDGQPFQNWDDYYVQCVEAAAGLRKVELDSDPRVH